MQPYDLESVRLVLVWWSRDASSQPCTIWSVFAWCLRGDFGKRACNHTIWSVRFVFAGRFREASMQPYDLDCSLGVCGAVWEATNKHKIWTVRLVFAGWVREAGAQPYNLECVCLVFAG